jgi:hypothetical protein
LNIGCQVEDVSNYTIAYSVFDTMFASKYSGSKAVDHALRTSSVICVTLSSEDVRANFIRVDQVFRRLFNKANTTNILVILEDESGFSPLANETANLIETYFETLIKEEQVLN